MKRSLANEKLKLRKKDARNISLERDAAIESAAWTLFFNGYLCCCSDREFNWVCNISSKTWRNVAIVFILRLLHKRVIEFSYFGEDFRPFFDFFLLSKNSFDQFKWPGMPNTQLISILSLTNGKIRSPGSFTYILFYGIIGHIAFEFIISSSFQQS